MARRNFRDRALVVRTYDFGEADRIVVLLTRTHGIVRGVAKGVRRSRSRFGSRLQLFVELDVQLYPGRNLSMISGADTVDFLASGIIDSFPHYSAASAVLEVAAEVAGTDTDPFLFDLSVSTLKRLSNSPNPIALLDEFMLAVMDHAGWAPSLFDCAHCGRPGPHTAFHPGAGGAVCAVCKPPGSTEVSEDTLHGMWLLAHGHSDWVVDKHPELSNTIHALVAAHFQFHVERKLSALGVLNQV